MPITFFGADLAIQVRWENCYQANCHCGYVDFPTQPCSKSTSEFSNRHL